MDFILLTWFNNLMKEMSYICRLNEECKKIIMTNCGCYANSSLKKRCGHKLTRIRVRILQSLMECLIEYSIQ